jgi:hypothetical protein
MQMTMTNNPKKTCSTNDLEYLDLGQAAIICCVSDERFNKWIEKGIVPVIDRNGKKLIHSHDLIQHLIRHNIPIPDRLLQANNKKILFVLTDKDMPQSVATEIIWALFRLRKRTSYIFDFVRYDKNVELKIITLRPDIIVLLLQRGGDQEPANTIRKMASEVTPVYTFSTDSRIDLEMLLSE